MGLLYGTTRLLNSRKIITKKKKLYNGRCWKHITRVKQAIASHTVELTTFNDAGLKRNLYVPGSLVTSVSGSCAAAAAAASGGGDDGGVLVVIIIMRKQI